MFSGQRLADRAVRPGEITSAVESSSARVHHRQAAIPSAACISAMSPSGRVPGRAGQEGAFVLADQAAGVLHCQAALVHLAQQHHVAPAGFLGQLAGRGRGVVLADQRPATGRGPVRPLGSAFPNYITIIQAQQFERQRETTYPKKCRASLGPGGAACTTRPDSVSCTLMNVQVEPATSSSLPTTSRRTGLPKRSTDVRFWNASIGLGFVSRDDVFARLRPTSGYGKYCGYQRAIYSLDYWCDVTDCEQDAVTQLEELAFG